MPRVRAKIPPKKPEARVSEEEKAGEKVVFAILPSGRVAKLRMPRVKHAMAIRETAMVEAGVDPTQVPSEAQATDEKAEAARTRALVLVNEAMERVALRELLLGISERPVEIVYQDSFPGEDALRAKYRAVHEAAVAAATKEGLEPPRDTVEAQVAFDADRAIDEIAMAKSATIHPLTDLDWDREAGVLGELANSYEGTPEAADWVAVHTWAGRLLNGMRALGAAADGPKAPRRLIRSSGGFVT